MLNECYRRERNLVTRSIADETLIVPIKNHVGDLDSIYTLNESGSAIWQLLDGQTPASQIIAALTQTYNVSLEEAAHDVTEWLAQLQAEGLICTATEGSQA